MRKTLLFTVLFLLAISVYARYNIILQGDIQNLMLSQKDAGIDNIIKPAGMNISGYQGNVKVHIKNFGQVPVTSFLVSYKIGNQPPVSASWTGNLPPGDTTSYLFATTYTIPQGYYCIKAYTTLLYDSTYSNDTANKCVYGSIVMGIPFKDNFDYGYIPWYSNGSQWESGSPGGTLINAPHTAPNCWKTKINSSYAMVSIPDYLYSPMFDISNGYDSLVFYHWVDVYNNDKAYIEYLAVDSYGNKIWKKLGIMGDPNAVHWYNSGPNGFVGNGGIPGWHRSAYDISILADIANPAQIRFSFYCYYPNTHIPPSAGWAIDDFEMTSPTSTRDVGISKIITPAAGCNPEGVYLVNVRIKNYGPDPVNSIPVHSPGGWFIISDTILAGDSLDYNVGSVTLAQGDLLTFNVYTDLAGDTNKFNDTSFCTIMTLPAPAGIISGQNTFCSGTFSKNYSVPPIGQASYYVWSLPPGTLGNSTSNSIAVNFAPYSSSGTLTVIGVNSCGIGSSSVFNINIIPAPIVNAGPDQTINSGSSTSISVSVSSGTPPFTLLWNTGATTSNINITPNQTTYYTVTVMDANGCTATDSVRIIVISSNLLTTTVPNIIACPGNVVVPIHVYHFNDVASASLSLKFDSAVLTYLSYQNPNTLLSQGTLLVNSSADKVQLAWFSLTPASIDSGLLLELVFTGTSGNTNLSWDLQTQGACEYTYLDEFSIPAAYVNGSVTFEGCGNISGKISYDNMASTGFSNTWVRASQGGIVIKQVITNSQGNFVLSNLLNGSYEISAQTNKTWGGGSAVDALAIMKHFSGIASLAGIRLKAADVNASGFINSVDALQVARRFVQLITSFPAGDWLFERDTVLVFNNATVINLKGICVGDVNGSYIPGAKDGAPPLLRCKGFITPEGNTSFAIPFIMEQDAAVSSVSVIMSNTGNKVKIVDVKMEEAGTLVFNLENNQLRLAWYNLAPLILHKGDTLFKLQCEPLQMADRLIPDFKFEAGTVFSDFEAQEIPGLQLSYPAIILNKEVPWLGQNIPNPFSATTQIPFFLPVAGHARLSVKDLLGREIIVLLNQDLSAGNHETIMRNTNFKPGIYQYEIELQLNGVYQHLLKKMVIQ